MIEPIRVDFRKRHIVIELDNGTFMIPQYRAIVKNSFTLIPYYILDMFSPFVPIDRQTFEEVNDLPIPPTNIPIHANIYGRTINRWIDIKPIIGNDVGFENFCLISLFDNYHNYFSNDNPNFEESVNQKMEQFQKSWEFTGATYITHVKNAK